VALQEAPLLEAGEMETPEATLPEAEEMESPAAVASVAPRPEEVESPASPDREEVESPAASRRNPEEESPATPEVVGLTWWCVVELPNVKLSARLASTTNIRMGKERLARRGATSAKTSMSWMQLALTVSLVLLNLAVWKSSLRFCLLGSSDNYSDNVIRVLGCCKRIQALSISLSFSTSIHYPGVVR
jgi:hypothetical protein